MLSHAATQSTRASTVRRRVLSALELDRGTIDAERSDQILTEWTQRMAAAPGVRNASIATVVPLALTGREEFDIALPTDAQGTKRRVVANRVTPGWFQTVRLPIVLGRDFTWNDRKGTTPVAITNETLARQFTNGEVLGQRLRYGTGLEVIGIARDTKYWTLGEEPTPIVYLPLRQVYLFYVTLHARTSDPRTTVALMTTEMQRLLPGAQMDVVPMSDAVDFAVMPARIGAAATGAFGVLAVGLAALGVYGLVSFSVVQRTREIGIRRATGATSADIVRLVVRHHDAHWHRPHHRGDDGGTRRDDLPGVSDWRGAHGPSRPGRGDRRGGWSGSRRASCR